MSATPYLVWHFQDRDVVNWFANLRLAAQSLNELSLKVKDAIGYDWDNNHYFVTNIFGRLALQLYFYEDGSGIDAWEYNSGVSVGQIMSYDHLAYLVGLSTEGRAPCYECKQPTKTNELVHFGFTGGVCRKCYKPDKHLPPDTRGD